MTGLPPWTAWGYPDDQLAGIRAVEQAVDDFRRLLQPVHHILGPRRAGILRLAAEETGNGRVVLLLSEIFGEAAVLLSCRFRLPANVRLWLLADIHPHSDLRPLYPRKRTSGRWSLNVCF